MRKGFLILTLGGIFLVSCKPDEPILFDESTKNVAVNDEKEDEELSPSETENNITVSFVVALDDVYKNADEDEIITRCIIEVYYEGEKIGKETASPDKNNLFRFSFELDETKQYHALIWADGGEDTYNVSSGLESIRPGVNPTIAFSGVIEDCFSFEYILLKPVVAKVTFKQIKDLEGTEKGTISVAADTPLNYSYNIRSGNVERTEEYYTPQMIVTPSKKITSLYVFAPNSGTNIDFQAYYGELFTGIKGIPIKPNYNTILKGDLNTMTLSIEFASMWNTNNTEVNFN